MKNLYNQITNISKYSNIWLLVFIVIGFLIRLYKIDNPVADWHSWRQADTVAVSRIYIEEGIDLLHPRYYDISTAQSGKFNPNGWRMVEFPLFNVLNAVLYKFFPILTVEIWGRLISIFSAIFSSIFLYRITNYLSKSAVIGLLSAFFYLTLPYNVYFTRVILPEPFAVFLSLAGVWYSILYLNSLKKIQLFTSAILFSLALLVKPYTIFFLIPVLLLFVSKQGLNEVLSNKLYYSAIVLMLMPFLLWRMWISQFPEGIPFWKWAFNEDGIRFRPAFWRWIFGERVGRLILGIWGLVPFSLGILSASKKHKFVNYFLLASLFFVTTIATANVKHDYYQTYIIPSISIALAAGTVYLWESKTFEKFISRGLLILSLFLMYGISLYQVKEFYKVNHPQIITAGDAVNRLTEKDALVIAPYNGDTAFLYQTDRFGWPVVDRSIPELIEKGADYYVSVNYDDLTNDLMQKYQIIEQTEDYIIIKFGE